MAKLSPYPCQLLPFLEPWSDDESFEGVKLSLPGDERGSVTEVHLTDKGVQVVWSMVQKCVHFFGPVMDMPKPTLGPSIPCGVKFSQWVEAT